MQASDQVAGLLFAGDRSGDLRRVCLGVLAERFLLPFFVISEGFEIRLWRPGFRV